MQVRGRAFQDFLLNVFDVEFRRWPGYLRGEEKPSIMCGVHRIEALNNNLMLSLYSVVSTLALKRRAERFRCWWSGVDRLGALRP